MLPQEEALDILVEFLHVHGYTKVKGIPLETIRLLASIVLKENVFVYGKKIYQQVLGGAMGSSFRLTLANIFMWKWQKELVRRQDMTCEYYGRYIDDVFMTWNKSENALKQILENANAWHPNIKLEYKIGKSLPFLDILLTNINGTLSTSVYHKPAAEPYVVPFTSDHPRHVFDNIVQTSLRRAIKYSSTFQLFNDERRYIKSTFLYNGYPSSFIDKTFRKFFSDYISSRSFLPFLDNEAQFIQMRIALSGQPSRQQSQVEMRIATLTYDKDHLVEDLDKKEEFIIQENKKPNKLQNKLIIHYTHEKRFNTRKRDLHRIFQETFANTQIIETKLIVGNRNQKSTMKEMIRKCPRQAILKNKAKPSMISDKKKSHPHPQGQQQQQRRQSRSNRPQNRSRNGSNQQQRQRSRSGQRPQQPQRRNRPRQLRLNDFMPRELRDPSPTTTSNLPSEFNLGATTTTEAAAITTAPPDALPQTERFAATTTTAFDTNNNTQPFIVNRQQQQSTTSSHRRQTRRGKQQRYRSTSNENNNRYALLSDDNDIENDNDVVEIDAPIITANQNNKKTKITNKKTHLYLEPTRMLRWFEDNSKSSKNSASGLGNQAYLLATAPIYDEWIRNSYELQVWQTYSKMATEYKHWAKEVVQRTKRRDDTTNSRFVQKKMNQLMTGIAQASANISDLQIQLATYWEYNAAEMTAQKQAQTTPELTTNLIIERTGLTTTTTQVRSPTTMTASTITKVQSLDPVERLENHILEYIHHCTLHVKKMAENRIQLAKAQMAEFKALEDFEQIATPSQWNIHLMLKPKVKLCSTKNKNKTIATKRVEYDLPPKFISKIDLTFKIDESIVNKDEIQATYDEMRKITKDFRTQAMKLYVQSLEREYELLSNEIKRIIQGFPSENDDGFDAEAGCAAFKQYHQLRQKRFDLEVKQSCYFLAGQRVEGEQNNPELFAVPTLIRSLGEDFLLQQ
ncbi:unnamed protein product [Rotaria socialis]|nr:unnamed protein product [Rotaria socialis]